MQGVIVMGRTVGEENNKEETDNKDDGVEDDKADYNNMVAMVTIVATITLLVLLPRSEEGLITYH